MYRNLTFALLLLLFAGILAGLWGIQRLGGWRYTMHRLHTQSAWPAYTQRMSHFEVLPAIESGDVVLIGDSHVAFGQWDELLPQHHLRNRGVPGEGITGLRAFAKTLPLAAVQAVVVQIGTNDLLFDEPAGVASSYDSLVAELLQQLPPTSAKLYLVTLPGVNNDVRWTGIAEQDVAKLNVHILSYASNPRVQVVDLADALGTTAGLLPAKLTDDGVHLRGDGYSRWATLLGGVLPKGVSLR